MVNSLCYIICFIVVIAGFYKFLAKYSIVLSPTQPLYFLIIKY
uniref:Uncharacterized protein n=1 Tax=Rhizophora mucronata TaxID=61149 RepID=A0A2P2NU92_RHIMU